MDRSVSGLKPGPKGTAKTTKTAKAPFLMNCWFFFAVFAIFAVQFFDLRYPRTEMPLNRSPREDSCPPTT